MSNPLDSLIDMRLERGLIGALILDRTCWPHIAAETSGADCHEYAVGRLLDGMLALAQAGRDTTDYRLAFPALRLMGVADSLLTPLEWGRLAQDSCLVGTIGYYAERLHQLANLRKIRGIGEELAAKTLTPQASDADLASWCKAACDVILSGATVGAESFGTIAERVIERLRTTKEHSGPGCMTGLQKLDELTGAIRPGEMLVIAARPGIGKTSLAMQIAAHNANRGRSVLFVSLEMTGDELVARCLAAGANVAATVIRSESASPEEISRLSTFAREKHGLPIRVYAPAKAKMGAIEANAKIVASIPEGLSAVIVDYIGLVDADDRRQQRHEQVAEISKALKRMSKELKVPVIALCQLNREAEKEVPLLSHLRESGAIEQDADMVWFIHLPKGRKERDQDGNIPANIIVAKNRHGDIGSIDCVFNPKATSFEEPSHEWRPNY